MRILIVEDDRFYSQAIAELLSDRDLEVTVAYSTQEAVAADARSYDGAVIDVMLPNDPAQSGITTEESRGGFCAGVCVARRFLRQNANIRVILLTSDIVDSEAETWASERSIPFIRKDEGSAALLRALERISLTGSDWTPLAFIVHGHDEVALLQLKNYIQNTLRWREPVVLREQPNLGKTVIEKFEDFERRIDCVFVLLTPDDQALEGATHVEKRRSRQNVVFELGFFYAALGRRAGRVLLLHRGPVELPSDIAGVVWIDIGNGIEAAGEAMRREIGAFIPDASDREVKSA
jgi:predicted nucleotide-binding protein